MGNALICTTDESTFNTPIGSCAVKHCGCIGTKKQDEEDETIKQINVAIRAELVAVEFEMRKQMLAALQEHRVIMPVNVNPAVPLTVRSLSVRIKTVGDAPVPAVE